MTVEINIVNVSKSFHQRQVLSNVNLQVEKGMTIGIVGSNGSGKSVLFKIICGITAPDEGEVFVREQKLGQDLDFPERVGVFINSPGFIELYTGLKNLQFLAELNGVISNDEIRKTMKLVGLEPDNKTKVKDYSLGMKQKLGIAQAIMENQDILILDEPFNALDYKTYQDTKELVKVLRQEGRTILMTSHNYEDLEQLCDVTYIIVDGRLSLLTDEAKNKYFSR
ncbi:ABC transporter ATP-binding protein [Alkalihalobacterium bogoriense]|uniref:ABC transporter ATP-binding protein n=1 Tax=Alkalihalobacterium bogoriense TaxID=246272 RepID=UPI00047B9764|nr:ABC transporter ATP-binding protein [Alkalihalobacterium bogoriense]